MPEKMYPIMGGPSVPWSYMEPHDSQARANHQQSLQRLAERGGLSPCEAELIVTSRPLFRRGGDWDLEQLKRDWFARAERVNGHYEELEQLRDVLSQVHERLLTAWASCTLPHDVIPAELAQRCMDLVGNKS